MMTLETARWAYGDRRAYPWSQCRFCGRAADRNCEPVACMLCGTVQCKSRTECLICLYGWLPGWYRGGTSEAKQCGYSGCTDEAVTKAPRVKRACAGHVGRVKVNGTSLVDYVAERLKHRDSGKGWEHFRFVK
jgi:hypothetical protein